MRKSLIIFLSILSCALFANGQGSRPGISLPRGSNLPPVRLPLPPRQPILTPVVRNPLATSSSRSAVSTRYWDPNRAVNPNGPAQGNPMRTTRRDFRFPARDNTPLRDGRGNLLGTLAPGTRIQINKGAEKVMVGPDGRRHVYELVLGARLNDPARGSANSKIYGSGLIRRSAIPVQDRPTLRLPKPQRVTGPTTAYSLTGGRPKDTDLGYFNSKHEFVPYKFGNGKPPRGYSKQTPHRESTDYVARPIGPKNSQQKSYVNVLSKLPGSGGTATTVYKVDKLHPVTFHRLRDVPAKSVKLYKPGGAEPMRNMKFVKGYVVDPKTGQKTVGWAAEKAMKPKPAPQKGKKRKS
jgi:hypothetical protein